MGKSITIEFLLPGFQPLDSFIRGAWECPHFQPIGMMAETGGRTPNEARHFLAGIGWPTPKQPQSIGRTIGESMLYPHPNSAVERYLQEVIRYLEGKRPPLKAWNELFECGPHLVTVDVSSLPIEVVADCDTWLGNSKSAMGDLAGPFNVQLLENGGSKSRFAFAGVMRSPSDFVVRFVSLHFSRFNDDGPHSLLIVRASTQVWLRSGSLAGDFVDDEAADTNLQRLVDFCMSVRKRIVAPVEKVVLRFDNPNFIREAQRIETAFKELDAIRES